jgi:hypothetical protein
MADGPIKTALRQALSPACARRSVLVALVVGTILNLINQGDALVAGAGLTWWKIALTYIVPFCVATYGACSMALITARREAKARPAERSGQPGTEDAVQIAGGRS